MYLTHKYSNILYKYIHELTYNWLFLRAYIFMFQQFHGIATYSNNLVAKISVNFVDIRRPTKSMENYQPYGIAYL